MVDKTPIAWDSETFCFGEGNMLPKMVCASASCRNAHGGIDSTLLGNGDNLEEFLEWLLTDDETILVTHNGGYDYGVAMASYPQLTTLIWDAILSGKCTDTLWREKLLNLSTTGKLKNLLMPDGSTVKIRYHLKDLVLKYTGLDRSADKEGEDIWRLHYGDLDGMSASEYPDEAAEYAVQDANDTLKVYEAQERRFQDSSIASLETQGLQLAKSFALMLMTAWGMEVDQTRTDDMEEAVLALIEENKTLLEKEGILRTRTIGDPHKKHFEKACEMLPCRYEEGMDWTPYAEALAAAGIKFKKPKEKPGTKDTKKLQAYVAALYKRLGELPTETAKGAICLDAEIKEYLSEKDPVMMQLFKREELGKLVSQMIPALRSGKVVHPSYDAIKETGRTSSYDGGKARPGGDGERLYPSVNIQQIPNMIRDFDPRRCFKPRDGTVFFDVDASGLELASTGHVTYELFGESVHRDRYNAGVDLHAYLGSGLALRTESDQAPSSFPELIELTADFTMGCREEGILGDPMAVYEVFKNLANSDDKLLGRFYKHYRKFAKPVGLGFPGGLGAATMVEFARKTYGVHMTEAEAAAFKEMWLEVYPEMVLFFDWVNEQIDEYNVSSKIKFGRPESLYTYTSPMGMVRRGAAFCAAANGASMQTPGAEAALTGTIMVSRACYDPSLESVLFGCRPIAFVHDQIIGETTRDESLWAAQCEEVARLFREGMEMVLTSVKMRTDEALLTTAWTKSADPVRNEQGVLIPFVPEDLRVEVPN